MELCTIQFWGVVWGKIIDASPFFTFCAIIGGLYFSWRQLRKLSRASTAASYVEIFKFLQEDGMREARHHLITKLTEKQYSNWSECDKMKAEKVCGAYDVVAGMQVSELIERDFIEKKWRNSIIESWEAAEPMINEYRKNRGSGFWLDFERVYKKAKKSD